MIFCYFTLRKYLILISFQFRISEDYYIHSLWHRLTIYFFFQINFSHLHPVDILHPFSFFVHNCSPQPEPIPVPTILLPPTLQPMTNVTKLESPVTVADLSEPFIMFDASLAHTLSLTQPTLINTHPHLQNQHTSHDHYLQWYNLTIRNGSFILIIDICSYK